MAWTANCAARLGVGVMVAGPVRPADCGASLHPRRSLSFLTWICVDSAVSARGIGQEVRAGPGLGDSARPAAVTPNPESSRDALGCAAPPGVGDILLWGLRRQ